jgi:repressor LexA
MNKDGIDDWDVVLVKKQSTCNNWDIVVALVDDSATLKEFRKENWIVKLIPHSTNSDNKTIIVTENLIIQWIFVVNLGKI